MEKNIKAKVQAELAALGARPLMRPEYVVPGPFTFIGDFPDNSALGEADLTLSAAITSPCLRTAFTVGDNPEIALVVEAVQCTITKTTEVEGIISTLMSTAFLRHKVDNYEYRHDLAPCIDTIVQQTIAAFDSDETTATNVERGGRQRLKESFLLPFPFLVDLSMDELAVGTYAAVNGGGAISFVLTVYGYAMKRSYMLDVDRCWGPREAGKYAMSSPRLPGLTDFSRPGIEIAAASAISARNKKR